MIKDLHDRFKFFALEVIRFCREIPDEMEFKIVKGQLIRSATYSAANFRATSRAKSRPDFLNKLKIVEEELDESIFWIDLFKCLLIPSNPKTDALHQEATELISIIVASIKKTRNS